MALVPWLIIMVSAMDLHNTGGGGDADYKIWRGLLNLQMHANKVLVVSWPQGTVGGSEGCLLRARRHRLPPTDVMLKRSRDQFTGSARAGNPSGTGVVVHVVALSLSLSLASFFNLFCSETFILP